MAAGVLSLSLAMLAPLPGAGVEPHEMLADPALEARARQLSRNLRCLVCQNESIDESDAELARDLRRLVRERLVAGDSDAEVTAYVVSRYGDFVLLRPPFRADTYALWLGPPLLLAAAMGALALYFRRQRLAVPGDGGNGGQRPASLTAEEEAELARLLDGGEQK